MLLFAVLALPDTAFAVPVQDLYVAEVLVATQGDAALQEGARAGLRQVLVRVSGSIDVERDESIRRALRNPGRYYYQYGYDATDRTLMVAGEVRPAHLLRVSFEPAAVARLLREAGFPVWGSNRPGMLVWIAVNDEQGRRLLSDIDEHPLMSRLQSEARSRGLPLLFPLLDLEDTSRVSAAEVWGLFTARIDVASLRYNPDVVLAGRIQVLPGGAAGARWVYRIEDRWQSVEMSDDGSGGVIEQIVDRLADELASRYAVGSSQGEILVSVEAVDGVDDYAALSRYLESLTPVVDTFVMEVRDDEILFRLRIEGNVEQLQETIGLDDRLLLMTEGRPLTYRWTGN